MDLIYTVCNAMANTICKVKSYVLKRPSSLYFPISSNDIKIIRIHFGLLLLRHGLLTVLICAYLWLFVINFPIFEDELKKSAFEGQETPRHPLGKEFKSVFPLLSTPVQQPSQTPPFPRPAPPSSPSISCSCARTLLIY